MKQGSIITLPSPLEGEVGNAPALPGGGHARHRIRARPSPTVPSPARAEGFKAGLLSEIACASIGACDHRARANFGNHRRRRKRGCGGDCDRSISMAFASAASSPSALTSSISFVPRRVSSSRSMADSTPRARKTIHAQIGLKRGDIASCASGTTTCSRIPKGHSSQYSKRFALDPPPYPPPQGGRALAMPFLSHAQAH